MNLSPRWVDWFQAINIQAVHWTTAGPVDAPDTTIMDFAREHDFIVLTQDLDFGAILAATGGDKPSVVQVRADSASPEAIGERLLAALHQVAPELQQGALLTLDPGRGRLTLLPLRKR